MTEDSESLGDFRYRKSGYCFGKVRKWPRSCACPRNLKVTNVVRKRRRRFVLGALVFGCVLVAALFVGRSREDEVDINSGRVRTTDRLYCFRVNRITRETWLSRSLASEPLVVDWRRVNTFRFGTRYSAHHLYHDAINQIKKLEMLDLLVPFEPRVRRRITARVLSLWQSGSDEEVTRYVGLLEKAVSQLHDHGAKVFTMEKFEAFSAAR